MIINIGKYKGKSVGMVILRHPDYVKWALEKQDAEGQLVRIRTEMRRLISIFDAKPFNKKCSGHNCNRPVAKFTAYKNNCYNLYWWCENHDPYESGASSGTLHEIRTYEDALRYIEWVCGARKSDYASLIKSMAQAKGLPPRVGEDQVGRFFYGDNII